MACLRVEKSGWSADRSTTHSSTPGGDTHGGDTLHKDDSDKFVLC